MLVEVFIQNSLVLKLSYYHILYKKNNHQNIETTVAKHTLYTADKKCFISLKQSSPLSLSLIYEIVKKTCTLQGHTIFSHTLESSFYVCGGGGPIFVAFVGNPCLIQSDTVKTECFHKYAQFLWIGAVVHIITLQLHFNSFFPSSMFRRVFFKKKKLSLCSCLAYASVYTIFKCIMALDKFILHNTRSTEKDKG